MLWGISEMVNASMASNLCHLGYSAAFPENWLVGISGALGMKVSHFLSRNVFWENAVGYLRKGECSFQTFVIVFSIAWKLTSRDF